MRSTIKNGNTIFAKVSKDLSILHHVVEIDNDSTFHVVDHLPEISGGRLCGTLGYDESLLLLVPLSQKISTQTFTDDHIIAITLFLHSQKPLHSPALYSAHQDL